LDNTYEKVSLEAGLLYVFKGCDTPGNDTCPLVPHMAGGLEK
jgi:hypothetical protein